MCKEYLENLDDSWLCIDSLSEGPFSTNPGNKTEPSVQGFEETTSWKMKSQVQRLKLDSKGLTNEDSRFSSAQVSLRLTERGRVECHDDIQEPNTAPTPQLGS